MIQKLPYFLLIFLILFACGSLVLNMWLLSQQKFSAKPQINTTQSLPEQTDFFDSLLGSVATELVNIQGDQLTFKNTRGTALSFKLTPGTLIVYPDGTATASASKLKTGIKALLTVRTTHNQNEITSININSQ